MMLRHSGAVSRVRWTLSFALFWGAVLVGCERDDGASVDRNRAPETFITQGPDVSVDPTNPVDIFYRAHLYWRGEDIDGTIAGFRLAVDDTLDPDDWFFTTDTDSIFSFLAGEVGTAEHLFLIRAVDNEGKQDPTPDTLRFEAFTRTAPVVDFQTDLMTTESPTATITSPVEQGDTVLVNSDVTFVWTGSDEDGFVVRWETVFGNEEPVQHERDDTTRTVPGLTSGTHEFLVRAYDDAGAVSTSGGFFQFFSNFDPETIVSLPIQATLQRPWLSGPESILQMPLVPGDTIPFGSKLDFCWSSTDPDGPVVSWNWSFDLFSGTTTETCIDLAAVDVGDSVVAYCANSTRLGITTPLIVRGRDIHGNSEGHPAIYRFFVNYPPTVVIDTISQIPVNTSVRFGFEGDDIDSDPDELRYIWQFDSELASPVTTFDPDSLFLDAFFTEIGNHRLRMWAQDSEGFDAQSEEALLEFTVAPAPVASRSNIESGFPLDPSNHSKDRAKDRSKRRRREKEGGS